MLARREQQVEDVVELPDHKRLIKPKMEMSPGTPEAVAADEEHRRLRGLLVDMVEEVVLLETPGVNLNRITNQPALQLRLLHN
jgi:hypothetical protein